MVTEKRERPARERLLLAASELFYAEGIHTVGIDRVIEKAGVARGSLYGGFGSKDDLICAYLELRQTMRRERVMRHVDRQKEPRAKILAIFDELAERVTDPTWRGCAFINATAEGPLEDTKTRRVALDARAWMRDLFVGFCRELKLPSPERFGRRLVLLYDGAVVAASMEGDHDVVEDARLVVASLIDTARISKSKKKSKKGTP